jgi:hypothetical protein
MYICIYVYVFDLEKIKKTLNCLGRGLNNPPNPYGLARATRHQCFSRFGWLRLLVVRSRWSYLIFLAWPVTNIILFFYLFIISLFHYFPLLFIFSVLIILICSTHNFFQERHYFFITNNYNSTTPTTLYKHQ